MHMLKRLTVCIYCFKPSLCFFAFLQTLTVEPNLEDDSQGSWYPHFQSHHKISPLVLARGYILNARKNI